MLLFLSWVKKMDLAAASATSNHHIEARDDGFERVGLRLFEVVRANGETDAFGTLLLHTADRLASCSSHGLHFSLVL